MERSSAAIGSGRAAGRPPRVLVVDDEPAIRTICAEHLRVDGCEVLEASNGQEALELALAAAPDLMLVDVNMPLLDGFELAQALRADERTSRVPLVFLTGELDAGIEARAYGVGAVGFFEKPFDPSVVGAFVQRVLSQAVPSSDGHAA